MTNVVLALATGLFVSYLPHKVAKKWTGAGFLGTLWGLVLLPLAPVDPAGFLALTVIATALAVPIAGRAGKILGVKDDPRIIIDETVGYWAALLWIPRDLPHLLAAFALFRIFDVLKPPPVRQLEGLPGGFGVVLDDTAAGLLSCAVLHSARLALGW